MLFRYLPVFFCCGAGLEFLMINMNINDINFYKVYTKRVAEESAKTASILSEKVNHLIDLGL